MLFPNRSHGRGPAPAADVREVTLADLPRLRLPDRFHDAAGDLERAIASYAVRSYWLPATGECALILPWRHRPELPSLAFLSAFEHEGHLLDAVIASAIQADSKALIFLDALEFRRASFYARNGFELLERILTLEMVRSTPPPSPNGTSAMRFYQLSAQDDEALAATTELDHRAFPWLWWNTIDEFRAYLQSDDVEVWAGLLGGEIVSYVGMTHFPGWGHLDRIAVSPDHQRRGLGRAALDFAIRRMRDLGATRVSLSTQGDNTRSQRLYANAGFRRTPEHDYSVYGVVLDHELLPTKAERGEPAP